jgi:superfamily I DNA/RNA helicase
VACSRAMKFLYLTMPSYVQTWDATFTHTSRFIAEMDSGKYQQNAMEF